MSCKYCIYYSVRGNYVDGKFVQITSDDTKSGWCQYNPPNGSNSNRSYDCWPIVSEDEECGKYKEVSTPRWYKTYYYDVRKENSMLKKRLLYYKELHNAVGELGPLVGKKTNSTRLQIVKAIKKELELKKIKEQEHDNRPIKQAD